LHQFEFGQMWYGRIAHNYLMLGKQKGKA
jgi:hypothetical protein